MSEFFFSWACLSSEISSVFVIADVPKMAIGSFFQILSVDRRIWETTLVFLLMSNKDLWQPHVMGQIMLLSLVTAHELSWSIPLAGHRTLFGRGLSLWGTEAILWVMEFKGSGHILCGESVSWPGEPLCPGSHVVPSSPHTGGGVVGDWIGWNVPVGGKASSSSQSQASISKSGYSCLLWCVRCLLIT